MPLPTNPENSTCQACPYVLRTHDGLRLDCDPPMGQCLLEYEAHMSELQQRQCDPRVVNINGEDVIAQYAFNEY